MKRRTKERGITLVSLAVTIIVLLILTAVTVRLAIGDNGVITEAELAANGWDKAITDEQSDLARLASEMRKAKNRIPINGTTGGDSGQNPGGNTNETGGGNGGGEDNPSGGANPGQVYDENTKLTIDGKPVTIPGGATVSGVEGENTVDGGLVIYMVPAGETVDWNNEAEVEYAQKTYSQFVWIPVENPVLDLSSKPDSLVSNETVFAAVELEIARGKHPMAIKNADGNYFGVLYQFSYNGEKDKVEAVPYSSWQPLGTSYKEPGVQSASGKGDISSNLAYIDGILNRGYTSDMQTALQLDFNAMVESVIENQRFLGRKI